MSPQVTCRVAVLLFLLALATKASLAETRRWTDNTGGFLVEAELLEVKGDVAILQSSDSQHTTIPLARLSAADRKYIDTSDAVTAGQVQEQSPSEAELAEMRGLLKRMSDKPGEFSAAQKLGRYGEAAEPLVPELVDLLRSDEPGIQANAALTLGMIGTPATSATPALIDILKTRKSHSYLYMRVSYALTQMQPESKDAIPELIADIRRLDADKDSTSVYAISALGLFGAEAREAIPALIERLQRDEPPPQPVRGDGGEAYQLMNALARVPYRRVAAATALGQIAPGDAIVLETLTEIAGDSSLTGRNILVREAAMKALGEMGPLAKSSTKTLQDYLEQEADQRSSRLDRTAHEALSKINSELSAKDDADQKPRKSNPKAQANIGPSIEVLFPNGGEEIPRENSITVLWKSAGVNQPVKIEMHGGADDNPGGWYSVARKTTNDGSYDFAIPNNWGWVRFKVKISSLDGSVSDESDEHFMSKMQR